MIDLREVITEAVGDWLKERVQTAEQELVSGKEDLKRNYFNRTNTIFRFLEQNNIIGLTVYAKKNYLDAYTKLSNIEVRDHIFPKLPLYIAVPLYATREVSKIQKMVNMITEIYRILIIDNNLGKPGILNEKITGISEYDDYPSFLLTHGGISTTGKRKYNKENDLTLASFLDFLIQNGFEPINAAEDYRGITKYIINGDSIAAFKLFVDNDFIKPSEKMLEEYNIEEGSQIYNYFMSSVPRKAHLHEPDVDYKNGKIVSGNLVEKLRQEGLYYDMTEKKTQKVPFSTLFIIQSELYNAFNTYVSNGETISNIEDISLSKGSHFSSFSNDMKYVLKEFDRFIQYHELDSLNEKDKKEFLQNIYNECVNSIRGMEDSMNNVLVKIGLPKVVVKSKFLEKHITKDEDFIEAIKYFKEVIKLDRLS